MVPMIDLDRLLETAVMEGALHEGRDPSRVATMFGTRVYAADASGDVLQTPFANRFTAAERAFIEQWAGVMGDEEIGRRLGRTQDSIKIYRIRHELPSPMNHPDYITVNRIAGAIGTDIKSVIRLVEVGVLPVEVAPLADRLCRRMRRPAFYAWALRPSNWPYFIRSVRDTSRIRDEKLRRLLEKRKAQWGDEWLMPGEAGRILGVDHHDINRYIRSGRLRALVKYGNWFLLRSDVENATFPICRGRGSGLFETYGTARGDAFILLATGIGMPYDHVARMTRRWADGYGIRLRRGGIRRLGLESQLVKAFGLPLTRYGDEWWCDWRLVARRFPLLAQGWETIRRGGRPTVQQAKAVASVLARWFRLFRPDDPLVGRIHVSGTTSRDVLEAGVARYEAEVSGM